MLSRTRLYTLILLSLGLVVTVSVAIAAEDNAQDRLRAHLETLASPDLEGRGNRTGGLSLASEYIVEQMRLAGLEPASTDGFKRPVDVVVDAAPSRNVQLTIGDKVLAQGHEFEVAGFSGGADFDAPLVFAGYGISAPTVGWDDYSDLDVNGDVVLVLSGPPDAFESEFDSDPNAYLSSPKSKAAVALAMGAKALIIINDPRDYGDSATQKPDALPEFWPWHSLEGMPTAYLTKRAGQAVLGERLDELRNSMAGNPEAARGPLDIAASGNLSLRRTTETLYNVVGRLPSSPSEGEPLVIGAHYDGLGLGEPGSLVRGVHADTPQFHPGADDNASGIAVLIEAAHTLTAKTFQPKRPVYFAALVSEELGMRGSRVLAGELQRKHAAGTMVNMDMVGRLEDRTLYAALSDGSTDLSSALQAAAVRHGIRLRVEALQDRRSDHISFYEVGWHAVGLSTGRHVDYHMPSDTPAKINFEGLGQVQAFLVDVVIELVGSNNP